MALLGKTATVVLPGALLMLGWWREGWAGWRRAVTPLLPFLVLAAAAAAVTIWVENFREKVIDPVQWSPAQRVVLAGQVVWFYLGKLLFPRGLIHVYPSWTPDAARAASYIPAAAAVAVLLALWATRRAWGRGPVVGWAYYLLALLPVMGFINIDYHRLTPVADHFQYLAGMGMVALVVGASSVLFDRRARGGAGGDAAYHATGAALVAMLVVILGALSVRRAALFGDVERLWAQTVRLNPDSAIARRALAEHRRLRQDFDGAVAELEEAVRRQPHDQEGHEQLGQLLLERGERGRALEHLARGPLGRYTVWPHLSNYAVELLTRGDFVGAERCLRRALELSNDNPDVQANLAMLLATAGDPRVAKPEEAVRLARALCAAPGGHTPQNLITLAVATAAAGQLTDASNALDQAANIARLTGDEQLLVRVEQLRAQLGAWSGPR
jgi:Flp pilus assembly protein TadD